MKCAKCGYSIKVNKDGDKFYLVCSGRSNLGLCDVSIQVELTALEAAVASELERLLSECPDVELKEAADHTLPNAVADIDRKIDRLMVALAESTDLTMPYVNRTIQHLEQARQKLSERQAAQYKNPQPSVYHICFSTLPFEQKKLVAAQFIQEMRLEGEKAEVIWLVKKKVDAFRRLLSFLIASIQCISAT